MKESKQHLFFRFGFCLFYLASPNATALRIRGGEAELELLARGRCEHVGCFEAQTADLSKEFVIRWLFFVCCSVFVSVHGDTSVVLIIVRVVCKK